MDCNEIRNRLEELPAGNLSEEIRTHLAGCPGCGAEARALEQSSAWLSLLRQEAPQLFPRFWVGFWESLDRGVPDFWTVMTVLARRTSMVLAGLLVLLALGIRFFAEPAQPAVAGIDEPAQYWATSAQDDDAALGRERAVLTLVARTE